MLYNMRHVKSHQPVIMLIQYFLSKISVKPFFFHKQKSKNDKTYNIIKIHIDSMNFI